jgi:DNA-directed RNA polymerase subunit alpha
MLDASISSRELAPQVVEAPKPEITIIKEDSTYGQFVIEPLDRGYGITLGNPIRRMLLSSIEGAAISWVKIDGVLHEYSTIPHMKEEVMEFLMNVKGVRIRSVTDRPGKMRLEIAGEGRVCAGDIATSADFEIVNPEHHLATLDSEDASLSVEFNIEKGKGYRPVSHHGDGSMNALTGVLPVDAIFNPVKKVNYAVEKTRVGQVTDYERLVLEIWTDGSITPIESLKQSAEVLVTHFFLFSHLGKPVDAGAKTDLINVPPEVYQTPIEKLELSPRTLNCLKRAHISKVGQVLESTNDELLKIRNFGEKSLEEIMSKLSAHGMLSEEARLRPATGEATPEPGQEEAEDRADLVVKDEDGQGELAEYEGTDALRKALESINPPAQDEEEN